MPIEVFITVNRKPTMSVEEFRERVWRGIKGTSVAVKNALRSSDRVPVNTGALRSSITEFENRVALQILVGSPLRYAIVQEDGRTPGARWPPDQPIRQWVLNKGLLNDALARSTPDVKPFRGRTLGGFKGKKSRAARTARGRTSANKAQRILDGLVYLVRRKIGTKGFAGKKFFAAAAQAAGPILQRNVTNSLNAG